MLFLCIANMLYARTGGYVFSFFKKNAFLLLSIPVKSEQKKKPEDLHTCNIDKSFPVLFTVCEV